MTHLAEDRDIVDLDDPDPSGPALLEAPIELDQDSAPTFEERGRRRLEAGHRDLVVDCRGVRFCDGAGLRALTALSNEVLPDGSVTLAAPPRSLLRLLDATGLASRFELVPDGEPEAPASGRSRGRRRTSPR